MDAKKSKTEPGQNDVKPTGSVARLVERKANVKEREVSDRAKTGKGSGAQLTKDGKRPADQDPPHGPPKKKAKQIWPVVREMSWPAIPPPPPSQPSGSSSASKACLSSMFH